MRVIVFFDLPTDTAIARKKYTTFRKKLLENGFSMIQYSVYSKIVLNHTQKNSVENLVEVLAPNDGEVSILSITENQFQQMKWVSGKSKSDLLQSYDRLVIL